MGTIPEQFLAGVVHGTEQFAMAKHASIQGIPNLFLWQYWTRASGSRVQNPHSFSQTLWPQLALQIAQLRR